MEELYALLAALHRPCRRQGPGSAETSRLAMRLAGLEQAKGLKIADIGCGTGASSLLLAEDLAAEVTAVDFLPVFLEELQQRARARSLADRIRPLLYRDRNWPKEEENPGDLGTQISRCRRSLSSWEQNASST